MPYSLLTKDFSSRVLVRRFAFDKECDRESLLLLSQYLNLSYRYLSKENLFDEANAEMSFDFYAFNGGYVFEQRLVQMDVKGMSYLFKNPLKSARMAFDEVLVMTLSRDESLLAQAKDRLKHHYLRDKTNAALVLKSRLSLPMAPAVIQEGRLSSLTFEELSKNLRHVQKAEFETVYIGPDEKHPLIESVRPGSLNLVLANGYDRKPVNGPLQDEGLLLSFRFEALRDSRDARYLEAAFLGIEKAIRDFLIANYHVSAKTGHAVLTKSEALMWVSVDNGRLSMIEDHLMAFLEKDYRDIDIKDTLLEARCRLIGLAGSLEEAVTSLLSDKDLGLFDPKTKAGYPGGIVALDDYFADMAFDEAALKARLASLELGCLFVYPQGGQND